MSIFGKSSGVNSLNPDNTFGKGFTSISSNGIDIFSSDIEELDNNLKSFIEVADDGVSEIELSKTVDLAKKLSDNLAKLNRTGGITEINLDNCTLAIFDGDELNKVDRANIRLNLHDCDITVGAGSMIDNLCQCQKDIFNPGNSFTSEDNLFSKNDRIDLDNITNSFDDEEEEYNLNIDSFNDEENYESSNTFTEYDEYNSDDEYN